MDLRRGGTATSENDDGRDRSETAQEEGQGLAQPPTLHITEIGPWSEVKLELVGRYAVEYSKILAARHDPELYHVYIDGFAGTGLHVTRKGQLKWGSPVNAMAIEPPFREYFFVDHNPDYVRMLTRLAAPRPTAHVLLGDANVVLPAIVLPQVRYEDYRRGLRFLDPYGLDLNWNVVETIGRMRSIEIFLNFPIMDMNRNVLWGNLDAVSDAQRARMTAFWGDESWRAAAYEPGGLFNWETKQPLWKLVKAYQERLKRVAGFQWVPDPVPMRNRTNAVVYYLFFAAHKVAARKIVTYIFNKFRQQTPFT